MSEKVKMTFAAEVEVEMTREEYENYETRARILSEQFPQIPAYGKASSNSRMSWWDCVALEDPSFDPMGRGWGSGLSWMKDDDDNLLEEFEA